MADYYYNAATGEIEFTATVSQGYVYSVRPCTSTPHYMFPGQTGLVVSSYSFSPSCFSGIGPDSLPVVVNEIEITPGDVEYEHYLLIPSSSLTSLNTFGFTSQQPHIYFISSSEGDFDFSGYGRPINIELVVNHASGLVELGTLLNSQTCYYVSDFSTGDAINLSVRAPSVNFRGNGCIFKGRSNVNIQADSVKFYDSTTNASFGAYCPSLAITRNLPLQLDIIGNPTTVDLSPLYPQPTPTADELLQVNSFAYSKLSLNRYDGTSSDVSLSSSTVSSNWYFGGIAFLNGDHNTARETSMQTGTYAPTFHTLATAYNSPDASPVLDASKITVDTAFSFKGDISINSDFYLAAGRKFSLTFDGDYSLTDNGYYFNIGSGSELITHAVGVYKGVPLALKVPYVFNKQSLDDNIFTGVKLSKE